MGAVYAVRYPGQNFERMREGIRRFNDAVGTANTDDSGYHDFDVVRSKEARRNWTEPNLDGPW